MELRNNVEANRLEMVLEDGSIAFIEYALRDQQIIIYIHTEIPEAHQGKGLASILSHQAMEYAKAAGFRVLAECPVVAKYVSKHPEYHDMTYLVIE